MGYYLFSKMSQDMCSAFVVKANSELEARGKIQKDVPSYIDPKFLGEVEALIEEEESDVIPVHDL